MKLTLKGKLAWGLVLVLAIVHYDFWYWDDDSAVFGFMPVGLWFHALISLGAGIAWALVVRWAWPAWVEEWASQVEPHAEPDDGRGVSE